MRIVRALVAAALLTGCSPTGFMTTGPEPQAFTNPALLNCSARQVPVCNVDGGRTRKYSANCSCR